MPDLLATGLTWLDDQRHRHLSRRVLFRRRGRFSADPPIEIALDATVGRTRWETDDGNGVFERYEARDFIVRAIDLTAGGERLEPRRGDRIVERRGSTDWIYEVMAPAGEPEWSTDRECLSYRIHSKLVASEEAA
jgi:hypothetical protein